MILKNQNNNNLHIFILSAYISGIVFIGGQVLIPINAFYSLIYMIIIGVTYFVSLKYINTLVLMFGIRKRPLHNAAFVAVINTTILGSIQYFSFGNLSTKYYFHGIMFFAVTFCVSVMYYEGLKNSNKINKESIKLQFRLYLEILRGIILASIAFILGTAYSQSLSANPISSGEMILIGYTWFGVILFVAIPLMKTLMKFTKEMK